MNEKFLLSGAWPKSKAALFEFSEVCQGFAIINSHITPGNGPVLHGGRAVSSGPVLLCCKVTVGKGQP